MKLVHSHSWSVTPKQAVAIQDHLRTQVVLADDLGDVRTVAGVDVGFEEQNRVTRAAVAVLQVPGLELVEQAIARRPTTFPYIPGLLSFREIPAVLDALGELGRLPDLLLCDGQGLAHPRRFGFACHLGVLAGLPSIGVAKSRLLGTFTDPGRDKGAWTPLFDGDEQVGAVVRTRTGVRPLFVSPGHRISIATAVAWVLACTRRYRLPETTRWAHRLASGDTG